MRLSVAPVDARTAMIEAAEQLFADRGVGAVSLREVGQAAGQRNNSAAQYHFGSRDGLLRAVFEHRMVPINAARRAALDQLAAEPPATPEAERRALVDALVTPLADAVAAAEPSHYTRFLAQVMASELVASPTDRAVDHTAAYREVHLRLVASLDHLPPEVAHLRVANGVLLLVNALAASEQARSLGRPHTDPSVLRADLVDSIVGLLEAPTSAATSTRASGPSPTSNPLELAC
jgi:AcrR family transcriptional regulator